MLVISSFLFDDILMCIYHYRVTSAASAFAGGLEASRKKQIVIWPEWNEADINSEKWV